MPDNPDVENDIRKLVAEILEVEPHEVNPVAHFVKDLGMDSMMALEILASMEKKYKIKIPEEYLTKVTSLNSMVEIAKKLINNQ